MKHLLIIFLTLTYFHSFGESIKPYDWQKERKRYVLSDEERRLNEYFLLYHKEYNYDWENGNLFLYQTEHCITRVANSEAIQRHNRIYVSLRNVMEVINIKARSINKDGKVTLFDSSNLKEIKDENSDNSYKIFAIEGIEPDSEIEYLFTLKKEWSSSETTYVQFETPVKTESFLLSSPKKLVFDLKIYFDSAKIKSDTIDNRNRYSVLFENVQGLPREKFSFYDASRKRVESKLAYNFTKSRARLNTWTDASKSYYKFLIKVDDESEKRMERFAKTLADDKTLPIVNRIKNIEDKIKGSIKIISHSSEASHQNVPDILKYKQASVVGITRLFVLVFEHLGIPYNLVLTSDREIAKFDGSFDTWAYLDYYLIFFPETNGFLSPNENELRYPLVPAKFTANDGLFIEPITVGTVKSALGSIKMIPALPYTADKNDLTISVSFNPEMESNTVSQKLIFVGNDAAYLSSYYSAMAPDQKEKYVNEILRSYSSDVKNSKWSISESVVQNFPRFEIISKFATSHFIENAGNKILFKIGELIGPQTEMYRDENRVTDIDNVNNRGYEREINIDIPKGYRITNTDALKMYVAFSDGAETPFLFSSDFTVEGSNLKVAIKEFYKEIFAPLSRYEDFRKVINASADFNKVVLVLEKL